MGELNTTVYVHDLPFGETQNCFGPGDEVPEWAAKQMGAHCFEDGEHPYPESGSGKHSPPQDGPPPKAGDGSGTEAWAEYARAKGLKVDDDVKRGDIIDALTAAGIATE